MSEKNKFEDSLKKLEEITAKLEKGDLSLDEMLDYYSTGTKLASECSNMLRDARLKISKIDGENNNNDEF